jgi:hypothetical protein
VDDAPDATAPKIEMTSIKNGACVAEDVNDAEVAFYTNEPSECKWDFADKSWGTMTNDMRCSDKVLNMNAAQFCVDGEIREIDEAEIEEAYELFYESQRENIELMFNEADFRIEDQNGHLLNVEKLELLSEGERLVKMEEGVVVGISVDEESGRCRMGIVGDGDEREWDGVVVWNY